MSRSFLIKTDENLMFVARNSFTLTYEKDEIALVTSSGTEKFPVFSTFRSIYDHPRLLLFKDQQVYNVGFYASNTYNIHVGAKYKHITVSSKGYREVVEFFHEAQSRFLKHIIDTKSFQTEEFSLFMDEKIALSNGTSTLRGLVMINDKFLFNNDGLFIITDCPFYKELSKYFIYFTHSDKVCNFINFFTALQEKFYTT